MKLQIIPRGESLEIASIDTPPGSGSRTAATLLPFVFALTLFFSSTSELQARERQDLEINLKARRVSSAGHTHPAPDDQTARPGDVLHYTADFINRSDRALSRVAPTIPVPVGMELMLCPTLPNPAEASLDGRSFEAFPIKRKQILADGTKVLVEMPLSSYRAVRWHTGDLAPGATCTVSVCVRVLSSPLAQN